MSPITHSKFKRAWNDDFIHRLRIRITVELPICLGFAIGGATPKKRPAQCIAPASSIDSSCSRRLGLSGSRSRPLRLIRQQPFSELERLTLEQTPIQPVIEPDQRIMAPLLDNTTLVEHE